VAATTVLVGSAMALAMTVTRYHYPTDAVGGFCVAVAVVLGLALVIDRAPPRRRDRIESAGVGWRSLDV
jgi:undecaprenyl-diphosphatase